MTRAFLKSLRAFKTPLLSKHILIHNFLKVCQKGLVIQKLIEFIESFGDHARPRRAISFSAEVPAESPEHTDHFAHGRRARRGFTTMVKDVDGPPLLPLQVKLAVTVGVTFVVGDGAQVLNTPSRKHEHTDGILQAAAALQLEFLHPADAF